MKERREEKRKKNLPSASRQNYVMTFSSFFFKEEKKSKYAVPVKSSSDAYCYPFFLIFLLQSVHVYHYDFFSSNYTFILISLFVIDV